MNAIKKWIKHPKFYTILLIGRIFPDTIFFDKLYLKMMYKYKFHKKLDFNNPKTFNEKLQWLKIYNRNPEYTKMVDKYEIKKYVSETIGEEYTIPILGVWERFEDINFEQLPNQFVLKCTHDSGGIVIVKDKNTFDKENAKKIINHSLKRKYYKNTREWPYKNVKPRIIAEQYMEDESGYELKDYKIFCFNGNPMFIMVDTQRFINHKRNVYDINWKKVDIKLNFPNSDELKIDKPKCLDKMLELSRCLSKDIPFIRTDFYIINNKIFLGELTFFPGAGLQIIEPEQWQDELGKLIEIKRNI